MDSHQELAGYDIIWFPLIRSPHLIHNFIQLPPVVVVVDTKWGQQLSTNTLFYSLGPFLFTDCEERTCETIKFQ